VGILPTTGLPLPFFSAGGTSISLLMASVGILLSVSRNCAR
ncbi:MAG: FtsW/RodA/SpoVE family cell cycle protein, partial [Clostridia bacterium]